MEHLNFFYFVTTFFTGIISLSLSVFVYFKTKETLIQYYLYFYSAWTLLVVTYTFLSYTQANIPTMYPSVFELLKSFMSMFVGPLLLFTLPVFFHHVCSVPHANIKNIIFGGIAILLATNYYVSKHIIMNATVGRFSEYTAHTVVVLVILYTAIIGMYYSRKLQDPERRSLIMKISVSIGIFLPGIVHDVFREEVSLIRIFPIHYCVVSIIFTNHLLKHYRHHHPVSADTESDAMVERELDEEIFNKYNISPREQDVARLIVQGYRNQQIADKLSVTVSTVKKHITKIYQKLDIKSRYELIAFFKNLALDHIAGTNNHDIK